MTWSLLFPFFHLCRNTVPELEGLKGSTAQRASRDGACTAPGRVKSQISAKLSAHYSSQMQHLFGLINIPNLQFCLKEFFFKILPPESILLSFIAQQFRSLHSGYSLFSLQQEVFLSPQEIPLHRMARIKENASWAKKAEHYRSFSTFS